MRPGVGEKCRRSGLRQEEAAGERGERSEERGGEGDN